MLFRTTALAAAVLACSPGLATLVTIAGFTTGTDNSFTSASGSFVGTNSASFPSGTFTTPAEQAVTFGRLLAGGSGSRRATVGAFDNRDVITLSFGAGIQLPNNAGADFVVYEQGDAAQPEAYAVAVRLAGSSTFSDFRYELWDSQEGFQMATAFDLTSYGLGASDAIDAIMIMNLVQTIGETDYTFGGGEGFVESAPANTQSVGFDLPIGYGALKDGAFPLGEHDPDFSYVGVFHNLVAVPEPAAALFGTLLAGGLGMTVARRRREED